MTKPVTKFQDRYVETAIDDETVVMDLHSAEFFSLNDTAGAVWRLIDGQRNRQEILDLVALQYGVSGKDIADDVEEILGRFRGVGFID